MKTNTTVSIRYLGGQQFYGLEKHEKQITAPKIKVGDSVFDDNKNEIKLIKEINYGGEGTIFETDKKGVVCKIYNDQSRTNIKELKLRKIIDSQLNLQGFCFVQAVVFSANDKFVGFLMPLAKGQKLGKLFNPKKEVLSDFSNYTRVDLVQLCITILEKIKLLHSYNILIGDINDNNFLFASPTEVYGLDTDSYQIDKFPCPVGSPGYISPELMQKKGKDSSGHPIEGFKYFFREWNDEFFAIAVLLFKILMLGNRPYTKANSNLSADELSLRYDFPYTMDSISTNQNFHPDHHCKNIWSYFPNYIKKAFIDSFTGINKNNRLSPSDWLSKFTLYKKHLMNEITQIDRHCLLLYPNNFIDYKKLDSVNAKVDFTHKAFNLSLCLQKSLPLLNDQERLTLIATLEKDGKFDCQQYSIKLIENRGIWKTVTGSVIIA